MITYIAPCKNGDCLTVDKADLEFVKVDEVGQPVTGKANDDAGTWGADLLIKNDNKYEFRVPACTKPGPYVVRHEIIALMGASHPNGAQHYPNCVNIMVTGSGTDPHEGGTKGTDLYNANDPGLKLMIYGPIKYIIPGPALHTCGAGGGSNTPSSSLTATSSTIATPKAPTAFVKRPYVIPAGAAQGSGTISAHSVYSTGSAVYHYSSTPTPSAKPHGDQAYDNKVNADNNSGDKNTYNDNSVSDESVSDKSVDDKKTYGDKNTYNDKKTYGDKPVDDKKTYGDKPIDNKKTYGGNPHDDKTHGDQSYNYSDKSDSNSHPNQNTDSYTSPKSHIATGSTDKGSSTFDIPDDATLQQLITWLKEILALLKSKFGVDYRRHARDVVV